ncbi:DUF6491 family protein [Arenimonas alkanexedens]
MTRLLTLPAALLLLAACTDGGGTRSPDASRGPACIDPNAVRTWHNLDGEVIYVDTGRHKYRVDLMENCRELGNGGRMGLRGDSITGRVCGKFGDLVVLPHTSCRISRVSRIDEDAYALAIGARVDQDEDSSR